MTEQVNDASAAEPWYVNLAAPVCYERVNSGQQPEAMS